MKSDFLNKKNELVFIIITTVLITLTINIISSIGFTSFDKSDYSAISIFFLIVLLLLLFILYAVITSTLKSFQKEINLPVTFFRHDRKFIDLPYNPLSVHFRVNFSKFKETEKESLKKDDKFHFFFNSDFEIFFHQTIQVFLLFYIINKTDFKNRMKNFISFEELPESIQNNPYLNYWEIKDKNRNEYKVHLPSIKKIEVFGKNQSNLRFITDYGFVDLSWNLAYYQLRNFSEPYITEKKNQTEFDPHDFKIKIKLDVHIPENKIFKPSLNDFMNWVDEIELKLENLNWATNNENRIVSLLAEIKRTIKPLH